MSYEIITPAWVTRKALLALHFGLGRARRERDPVNLHDGAWFVAEAEVAARRATRQLGWFVAILIALDVLGYILLR